MKRLALITATLALAAPVAAGADVMPVAVDMSTPNYATGGCDTNPDGSRSCDYNVCAVAVWGYTESPYPIWWELGFVIDPTGADYTIGKFEFADAQCDPVNPDALTFMFSFGAHKQPPIKWRWPVSRTCTHSFGRNAYGTMPNCPQWSRSAHVHKRA